MQSSSIRNLVGCLGVLCALWTVSAANAQAQQRQLFMFRFQAEPGAMLARQNGPLTLSVDSAALAVSLAAGIRVGDSAAVGVEAFMVTSLITDMEFTSPDFDGTGNTVSPTAPSLTAFLVGPHVTRMFPKEMFSVSATLGLTFASLDYDTYPLYTDETETEVTLRYNRQRTIDPNTGDVDTIASHIPVDETGMGWGFGLSMSKLVPLSSALSLAVGAQFRYLSVPDDAEYFDDDSNGRLRYRAHTWSIASFGAHVALMYF